MRVSQCTAFIMLFNLRRRQQVFGFSLHVAETAVNNI